MSRATTTMTRLGVFLCIVAWVGLGCVSRSRNVRANEPDPLPVRSNVEVGECADSVSEGVVGEAPDLQHANRDLDGDGQDEIVVADRKLCSDDGNCHWNIYRTQGECHRYLGTISASSIQRMASRGDQGFFGLRGLWNLTGGQRLLMQEYRFQHDGYRLVEAILCRQADDDRLLCEERGR